jgi:hypothetical protein
VSGVPAITEAVSSKEEAEGRLARLKLADFLDIN